MFCSIIKISDQLQIWHANFQGSAGQQQIRQRLGDEDHWPIILSFPCSRSTRRRSHIDFLGLMLCIFSALPLHCPLSLQTNKSFIVSGALPHTDVVAWYGQPKEVQRQCCDAQGQHREAAASCFCVSAVSDSDKNSQRTLSDTEKHKEQPETKASLSPTSDHL